MNDERDFELHELIALAAVGALDGDERAALDAQLADRRELRAELDELEAVASTLADATAEPPPPGLRANVLDAIREVPQSTARGDGRGAVDGSSPVPPAPVASDSAPPVAPVVPLDAHRRRRWTPLAVAAAAVLLLAGGGLAARTLLDDDGDTVDVAAVVDDDAAVTLPMEGAISSIRLVHSSAHRAAALVGEDVPQPDGDQVYELWVIAGSSDPQRVEIFRPHDDGSVEMLMTDMDMPDDAVFAITVEPAGGTDAPTGAVVAATA